MNNVLLPYLKTAQGTVVAVYTRIQSSNQDIHNSIYIHIHWKTTISKLHRAFFSFYDSLFSSHHYFPEKKKGKFLRSDKHDKGFTTALKEVGGEGNSIIIHCWAFMWVTGSQVHAYINVHIIFVHEHRYIYILGGHWHTYSYLLWP